MTLIPRCKSLRYVSNHQMNTSHDYTSTPSCLSRTRWIVDVVSIHGLLQSTKHVANEERGRKVSGRPCRTPRSINLDFTCNIRFGRSVRRVDSPSRGPILLNNSLIICLLTYKGWLTRLSITLHHGHTNIAHLAMNSCLWWGRQVQA